MFKTTKICLTFILVLVVGVSLSFAGNNDRKRDRKKDGTCSYISDQDSSLITAAGRDRKTAKKRDGSC